jgi:cytochrome c
MKLVLIIAFTILINGCSTGGTSASTTRGPNSDPKTMKNPVPATPESLAAGKKLYERFCADCHGESGNGVSEMAATLVKAGKPKPSDLTDNEWDFGSTDGEIFLDIRDGVGSNAAMRGLNGKPGVGPQEMWKLVNYVRSLRPNP